MGCGHGKKVDVSNIDVNVKVERFDREFDAMRSMPMSKQVPYLENKYGVFEPWLCFYFIYESRAYSLLYYLPLILFILYAYVFVRVRSNSFSHISLMNKTLNILRSLIK